MRIRPKYRCVFGSFGAAVESEKRALPNVRIDGRGLASSSNTIVNQAEGPR
jgi:hypothetical protein